jgi:protein TonB
MANYNTPGENPTNGGRSPLGRLRSPVQESRIKVLASNMRDFLVERPAKFSGEEQIFANAGFGTGVAGNFKEFFKAGPKGKSNVGLMSTWDSGFGGFRQNLRELFAASKIPAGRQPLPEIWSQNPRLTRVKALSVAIHVAALALLVAPFMAEYWSPATTKPAEQVSFEPLPIHFYAAPSKPMTGGGSSHDKAPAAKAKAPQLATTQYAVPMSHPVEHPPIAMAATVLANPAIKLPDINSTNFGNPLANMLGNSLGDKGGNGVGDGDGNGVGNGGPYGVGAPGHPAGTGGYGNPACLYCPNAQFSDAAVKAKYQGVVLVAALITPDGRATNVRIVKGLGLGLDENAVAAVRTWRFRPATGPDGKPAAVLQTIEVEFRLI